MSKALRGMMVVCVLACAGQALAIPAKLVEIGSYRTGVFDDSAAEIVAHDPVLQRLYVVNGAEKRIDVLDVTDPRTPTLVNTLDVSSFGDGPTSVAVKNGIVAVAVEANVSTDPGQVVFFSTTGTFQNSVTVGALPDMVTFTPDGTKVVVANEGEPDGGIDPEGSISIVDISGGVGSATATTAGFTSFNADRANLEAAGVRIFASTPTVAQDLEPEYITVSDDSTTAFVSLQEANALAKVDLTTGVVTDILPMGLRDHSQAGQGIDPSDRDGGINIGNWPVFGMPMPDAVASFEVDGVTYVVTTNEGDDRGEDERIKDLTLDPVAFPDAVILQQDANLGRLAVSSIDGLNGSGEYEQLQSYGSRSFSIYDEDGNLVFDSGEQFEQIVAAQLPGLFNSDNDENTFDTRSDAKGPEPEAVTIGRINGRTLAYIGLERVGGIMVYDVTDPFAPVFLEYVNNRDINGDPEQDTAGDLGPEGLIFIDAADSPTGRPLVVVANEVSGSTTIYQVNSIPEPATAGLALMALSGAGMALLRRRSR